MSFVDLVEKTEVSDPISFARYVEQTLGVPYPTQKDMVILKRKIKEFFQRYPQCDYQTLIRTVGYCRAKKRRLAEAWRVVDQAKWAYEAGYCPEMSAKQDFVDLDLEKKIADALVVESDTAWRRGLIASSGEGRMHVYLEWKAERAQ